MYEHICKPTYGHMQTPKLESWHVPASKQQAFASTHLCVCVSLLCVCVFRSLIQKWSAYTVGALLCVNMCGTQESWPARMHITAPIPLWAALNIKWHHRIFIFEISCSSCDLCVMICVLWFVCYDLCVMILWFVRLGLSGCLLQQ